MAATGENYQDLGFQIRHAHMPFPKPKKTIFPAPNSEKCPLLARSGPSNWENHRTLSRSEYLVVYLGDSISRFICQYCYMPCKVKRAFPVFRIQMIEHLNQLFAASIRRVLIEKVELDHPWLKKSPNIIRRSGNDGHPSRFYPGTLLRR